MTDAYSNLSEFKCGWAPEYIDTGVYQYGKLAAARAVDEINQAADVFYPLPLKTNKYALINLWKDYEPAHQAGEGIDFGIPVNKGYKLIRFTLSGDMYYAMMFLKQLTTACTNSGGGSNLTHTYATSTARAASIPTFQFIYKFEHGSNSYVRLITGCSVVEGEISGAEGGIVQLSLTIEGRTVVTGADLTTWPVPITTYKQPYKFCDSDAIVFSKGGSAYAIKPTRYSIKWKDHKLDRKNNSLPYGVVYDWREITTELDYCPTTITDLSNIQAIDLATANVFLLTIRFYRNNTTDYVSWSIDKCIPQITEDPQFDGNGGYVQSRKLKAWIARHESGVGTFVAVDDLAGATYY